MKKGLMSLVALLLLLTPMTSFAAETDFVVPYTLDNTEESNYEDAVYDTENTGVLDWSDKVIYELVDDVPKLEDVDWKGLSDEELTEVINHSSYEEVGMFLLGLTDEEFEEILSRDTTLIYPIYTFTDKEDGTQEQGILAEHYYEHAIGRTAARAAGDSHR